MKNSWAMLNRRFWGVLKQTDAWDVWDRRLEHQGPTSHEASMRKCEGTLRGPVGHSIRDPPLTRWWVCAKV